jgi:D-alanyl-D-alanine endopeptidase (penicillin-binding protein 7)
MSVAAVVADLDTGREVYVKNADAVRPIASLGKIFLALVVRDKEVPLDGTTIITEEDRQHARGGARSRVPVGKTFTNIDLMRALLVASDNRACTALGRAAGLRPTDLVDAMNAKARALGLRRTKFTDPSGLNGNESTPREILVALRAALADPVLAEILTTPSVVIRSTDRHPVAIQYVNTNQSLRTSPHRIIGGKTGYTDEARYCLAIAAELDGRRIGMVFLGAEGELTRFADFNRVTRWLTAGGPEPPPARR